MGLVVENRFVYYCSPRTGSNAVQGTLTHGPNRREFFRIGQHMSYPEMIKAWPQYKSFPGVCNIRNPFEILASWLFHQKSFRSIRGMLRDCDHKDFMKEGLICYHVPYCQFLIRHGKNMAPVLNDILNHFKCTPIKGAVRSENVSKGRVPYQEVYKQVDIDAVRELCQDELDDLNYDFEGEPLG